MMEAMMMAAGAKKGGFVFVGYQSPSRVYKLDAKNLEQEDGSVNHGDIVWGVIFGDDGFLYSCSRDQTVKKTDIETMTVVDQFGGHTGDVICLSFGVDGFLYSAGDDGIRKINVRNMSQSRANTNLVWHDSICHDPNGYIYTATTNVVRKLNSFLNQVSSYSASAYCYTMTFGDDGFLYVAEDDIKITKLNPSDMTVADSFTGISNGVEDLIYGADGYLYAGDGEVLRKINPTNMNQVSATTLFGSGYQVYALSFDSEGYLYAGVHQQPVYKIDPSNMSVVEQATLGTGDTPRALCNNISINQLLGFN